MSRDNVSFPDSIERVDRDSYDVLKANGDEFVQRKVKRVVSLFGIYHYEIATLLRCPSKYVSLYFRVENTGRVSAAIRDSMRWFLVSAHRSFHDGKCLPEGDDERAVHDLQEQRNILETWHGKARKRHISFSPRQRETLRKFLADKRNATDDGLNELVFECKRLCCNNVDRKLLTKHKVLDWIRNEKHRKKIKKQ